jgi:hypothetical protein
MSSQSVNMTNVEPIEMIKSEIISSNFTWKQWVKIQLTYINFSNIALIITVIVLTSNIKSTISNQESQNSLSNQLLFDLASTRSYYDDIITNTNAIMSSIQTSISSFNETSQNRIQSITTILKQIDNLNITSVLELYEMIISINNTLNSNSITSKGFNSSLSSLINTITQINASLSIDISSIIFNSKIGLTQLTSISSVSSSNNQLIIANYTSAVKSKFSVSFNLMLSTNTNSFTQGWLSVPNQSYRVCEFIVDTTITVGSFISQTCNIVAPLNIGDIVQLILYNGPLDCSSAGDSCIFSVTLLDNI